MSHIDIIKCEIKSLQALKLACKRINCTFKENQKTYHWYGQHIGDYPIPEGLTINDMGKCIHAIEVPGSKYDVGVIKDPVNSQNYKLIWDFWKGGNLIKILGNDASLLVSAYEAEQAKLTATYQNRIFTEKENEKEILLEIYMD